MSLNKRVKMSIEEANCTSSTSQTIKSIHRTDHAILALEHMKTLKNFNDVELIAGKDGRRVSAHRLVLSASSPYFYAMFSGSMREAKEYEVTLNDVRGDILEALVEFCYSGRIQLQQDTVEMLLKSASLFQMNSVVTECTNYLVEQLDPSNCLGITFFAEQHNCKELQKEAEDYTHQRFMQVCKNEEFFKLDAPQLAAIIASDDVNVSSEEDVFNSILDWLNCDLSERKQYICELLPQVRMTQLPLSFIANHVEPVCRSNECLHLLNTEYTKPRTSTGTLFAIGAPHADAKVHIECYCPRSEKWTVWNDEIGHRVEFGVATMGDNLIILGGISGARVRNTVVNINFTTLAVTELTPLVKPCCGLCVAVVDNYLYAIGGRDSRHYLNAVERYNPEESIWDDMAPMSIARVYAGAAVLNGCIYVVGGFNGSGCLRTVESYDPRSNTWTKRASMAVARRRFGIGVSDGFLYAVGGVNKNGAARTAECYDPVADKWTMIEPMSMVRGASTCAFLGKRLMAAGGVRSNVEEYDTQTNNWNKKLSLTKNYHKVAVFVVPNRHLSNLSVQNGDGCVSGFEPRSLKFTCQRDNRLLTLAVARRRAAQLRARINLHRERLDMV